jgi:hypothetical protein
MVDVVAVPAWEAVCAESVGGSGPWGVELRLGAMQLRAGAVL